jgi:hypothetical protein
MVHDDQIAALHVQDFLLLEVRDAAADVTSPAPAWPPADPGSGARMIARTIHRREYPFAVRSSMPWAALQAVDWKIWAMVQSACTAQTDYPATSKPIWLPRETRLAETEVAAKLHHDFE